MNLCFDTFILNLRRYLRMKEGPSSCVWRLRVQKRASPDTEKICNQDLSCLEIKGNANYLDCLLITPK